MEILTRMAVPPVLVYSPGVTFMSSTDDQPAPNAPDSRGAELL